MLETIREDVTRILGTADIQFQQPAMNLPELPDFLTTHIDPFTGKNDAGGVPRLSGAMPGGDPYAGAGLSRNAPCPCGSGQKYKQCHGVAA